MTALFPSFPGLTWPVTKTNVWSARVAAHASGREVVTSLYAYPLYRFELTFAYLVAADQTALRGFYNQCQGQLQTFRFLDTTDNQVVDQVQGVGDGATTLFTGVRNAGGWVEPVGFIESIRNVYINGAAVGSGWSVAAPNGIAFSAAPAAGAVISADFTFSYLCRFAEDTAEIENFLSGLWSMKSLKIRSVRA